MELWRELYMDFSRMEHPPKAVYLRPAEWEQLTRELMDPAWRGIKRPPMLPGEESATIHGVKIRPARA